ASVAGGRECELMLQCGRPILDDGGVARVHALARRAVDWAALVRMALHHGLLAFLARHLTTMPDAVPPPVLDHLTSFMRKNANQNRFLLGEVGRLVAALGERGITAVPVSGVVSGAVIYDDPTLSGDQQSQLLLRPGSGARAASLLGALGYP